MRGPPLRDRRAAAGAVERVCHLFTFAPLDGETRRPLLLAGPPGAGKTVTAAKLATRAVVAGKPVRGFETVDQQLHFFADMAPALQVSMLESMLQDLDEGPGKLDEIVRAWREGDEAKLTRLVVDEMKRPFPQLYRTLFLRRNKAWADRIATMVKGSGVSFIAVGAGHLAGPDSVQNQLKKRGVRVDRILPRP